MAVKLRMTRIGRRHRPFFRINAVDSRTPRDGRVIEKLGHYDPLEKDESKQIVINRERIEYWLGVGAIPSKSVSDILLRHGIKSKHAEVKNVRRDKAKAIARTQGRCFTETERITAAKAAEKAKADAEAKAKAEAEAKAKAKAEAEALQKSDGAAAKQPEA
ncbi:MAG: 30S ribosomal protein S16 [Planctomycetota bacterium]